MSKATISIVSDRRTGEHFFWIYLNFSSRMTVPSRNTAATAPMGEEDGEEEPRIPNTSFQLSSNGSGAPTQPLLTQHKVFLEGTGLGVQRV